MRNFVAIVFFFLAQAGFSDFYFFIVDPADLSLVRAKVSTDSQLSVKLPEGYQIQVSQSQFNAGYAALDSDFVTSSIQSIDELFHWNKSAGLKSAENSMLLFLRRAGYVATNALLVPSDITERVLTNLTSLGRANPTSAAVDNLVLRFHSSFELLTFNGGMLEDIVWHPGY